MSGKILHGHGWVALAVVVAALCFATGRWSAAAGDADGDDGGSGREGGAVAESVPQRRHAPVPVRKENAAGTADTGKEVPKVAIPRSVVKKLLMKELASGGFDSLEEISRTTNSALDLLDVTEEERKAVLATVEKMRDEVKEAERKTAVLKGVTESSVALDMSGMRGALESIRANMDLGIGSALPRDKANLLIDGYPWDLIYPEKEMVEVAFSVERTGERGTLMATRRFSGNRMSVGIRHWSNFKDDGKPLRAEGVFEGRWAHLMEGRTLLPVDMK